MCVCVESIEVILTSNVVRSLGHVGVPVYEVLTYTHSGHVISPARHSQRLFNMLEPLPLGSY